MPLNPYLMFDGRCEAAFKFYEKVLGGKIEAMMTYGSSPMAEQTSPEWRNKVMHARMTVGDKMLMASDAPPDRYEAMKGFSVTISVERPGRGRAHIPCVVGKRDGTDAHTEDILGCTLWHARRSIRHAMDDQLRAGRLALG